MELGVKRRIEHGGLMFMLPEAWHLLAKRGPKRTQQENVYIYRVKLNWFISVNGDTYCLSKSLGA